MKLIGINPDTNQLRLPRGAPYHLKLRVVDSAGGPEVMDGRDLAFTIYRGSVVIFSSAGAIGEDDIGPFAAFALTGTDTDALPASCSWEVAELYTDGKVPMLTGAVFVAPAAESATGDGSYVPSSAADEVTWSPASDVLIILERGARGDQGPAGAEAFITRTAGEAIGGHRGVRIGSAGIAFLSDPSSPLAVDTIGISDSATMIGQPARIRAVGEIVDPSWDWVAGPVWLGTAGVPTQTPPTAGVLVRIGVAAGPHTISLSPQVIAKL